MTLDQLSPKCPHSVPGFDSISNMGKQRQMWRRSLVFHNPLAEECWDDDVKLKKIEAALIFWVTALHKDGVEHNMNFTMNYIFILWEVNLVLQAWQHPFITNVNWSHHCVKKIFIQFICILLIFNIIPSWNQVETNHIVLYMLTQN